MPNYVAYYRISPGGRRKDKAELQAAVDADRDDTLGLEAQRRAVAGFLKGIAPIAEYTEIESGKRHTNRPRLTAALDECRRTGATLIIAKLDRLARNVAFIANLMEGKVPFTAVDLPTLDPFTIHIFAAVAENERATTSKRVKAALAVIKAKADAGEAIGHDREGNPLFKLGNPNLAAARERSRTAHKTKEGAGASPEIKMLIAEWRKQSWPLAKIAGTLNERGVRSPKGKKWWAGSVRRNWTK